MQSKNPLCTRYNYSQKKGTQINKIKFIKSQTVRSYSVSWLEKQVFEVVLSKL